MFEDIYTEAFQFLTKTVTSRPKIGIVCGSGLGKFGDTVKDVKIFDYKELGCKFFYFQTTL
jgi:purine nucleoside phosphorylase